jgi:hypothetical protein
MPATAVPWPSSSVPPSPVPVKSPSATMRPLNSG